MDSRHIQKGAFHFADAFDRLDIRADYYYSDDYFQASATKLCIPLRTMSLNLALSFFPSAEADFSDKEKNARALLADIGFSGFTVNPDYKRKPDIDSLGIGAAYKNLTDAYGEFSLITVGLRGASYGEEWASNIIIGTEGAATGFAKCRDAVLDFLRTYIENNRDDLCGRLKYWITGYSRVGAIANITGAYIDDHADEFSTCTEDIFCYTFASPLAADARDPATHPCIHNTVNPFDMVSLIPPSTWGFQRYGNDDTVLPSGASNEYSEKIGEVIERLHSLNPHIHYDADHFTPTFQYGGKITHIKDHEDLGGRARPESWWFHAAQDEYLKRFIDFMSRHIVEESDLKEISPYERRRQFVEYFQKAFSEGARVYLGTTLERRKRMRNTMGAVVKTDMTPLQKAHIYLLLYCNNRFSYKKVERYMDRLLEARVRAMPDSLMDIEELRAFGRIVQPMVYYFIKSASRDVRRYRFAYLSSLVENLDRITAAHNPELMLAWLQTLDENYTQ